jgi:hypothetical protein
MKKAVFIGNCQMSGIREVLRYTPFYENYMVEQFANWQMIESNSAPPTRSLSTADLVIYQPLSDVHGCFSTNPENPNSMLKNCKPDAITISIPRIHNNSLWPLFRKNRDRQVYYGGEYLKHCRPLSLDDLLYGYDTGQLNFDFESRYARNRDISLVKEQSTDVKVSEYIHHNLRKKRLFLTQDHPTTDLFIHCTRQVCDILDIEFPPTPELGDNITGLQDSVYHNSSCRYPGSTYANQYFAFEWDTCVDNIFYRDVLIEHQKTL